MRLIRMIKLLKNKSKIKDKKIKKIRIKQILIKNVQKNKIFVAHN
jgi:hypothetical protein